MLLDGTLFYSQTVITKTAKTEKHSSQIDCHSRIHSTVKEVKAETTKRERL